MASDPRDYKLDLSSTQKAPDEKNVGRPFISVHFACCGVYQRLYRDPSEKEYAGRCPKCSKRVRFVVGEGGTESRSFVVS